MYRSKLTNYQVIGVCLLALGFGGALARLPVDPTLWGFAALLIGAAFVSFGKPLEETEPWPRPSSEIQPPEPWPRYHIGEVVVTWNEQRTRILAVTRQDDEGEILSVIAEAPRDTSPREPTRKQVTYCGRCDAEREYDSERKCVVCRKYVVIEDAAPATVEPRDTPPREPTEDMIHAGRRVQIKHQTDESYRPGHSNVTQIWRAMYDAAHAESRPGSDLPTTESKSRIALERLRAEYFVAGGEMSTIEAAKLVGWALGYSADSSVNHLTSYEAGK